MAEDRLDFRIQTKQHARGWILVPIQVGEFITLLPVLNTGFLFTTISSATRDILGAFGHLDPMAARTFWLRGLSTEGVSLPDLQVRTGVAAGILEVEGILGLDFLRQFEDVEYNVPSGVLRLRG